MIPRTRLRDDADDDDGDDDDDDVVVAVMIGTVDTIVVEGQDRIPWETDHL